MLMYDMYVILDNDVVTAAETLAIRWYSEEVQWQMWS